MLVWKKIGKIFDPTEMNSSSWMQEYAQCPTPFLLNEEILRVYISSRPKKRADSQRVAYPGYVDLLRSDLSKVMSVSEAPLLPLGERGAFDEFGMMPSSVVRNGAKVYLYYTGWTRMSSVPFTVGIGLAISEDGGRTFSKMGKGPVLGLTLKEPYLTNSPIVQKIGATWHMWYLTGTKWLPNAGAPEAVFQIVHAVSDDGIDWVRDGIPIVSTKSEDECQDLFAPFFHAGRWHAVFGYRKPIGFRSDPACAYRLGYASSVDLQNWTRDDSQVGITVSPSGWDAEMICSSQTFELDGRRLLFYCGNGFGREGFGVAELQDYSG
ncbi:MAG: hypothetical protein ING54_02335 [Rhodocyclaceae bacterium]|jgi:hypothetical protein|nr:hypothetical protein [Rhodocyclaceae bacterium]MCA3051878.1 hypothetical protein [Rhodocyclaceae bacterium]